MATAAHRVLAGQGRSGRAAPTTGQASARTFDGGKPSSGSTANRLEILALLRGWNLGIGEIALREIFLWHGEQDRLTPIGPARLLADTLPHCSATFYRDEGHFSTLANHAHEVFAALRRDGRFEP